jgi:hypothetical protein
MQILHTVQLETNEYIKNNIEKVINSLTPLIGQKITLSDCETQSKNFAAFKPEPLRVKKEVYFLDIHTWFQFNKHSVYLYVNTCVNGGSYDVKPVTAFCEYLTEKICIGSIENQMLTKIEPVELERFKTISPTETEYLIRNFERLKERANTAYYLIPEHIRRTENIRKD